MKTTKKNMSVNNFLKELEQTSKYLTEAYIFDGDEPMQGEDMPMDYDAQGEDPEATDRDISREDNRIAKIREVALDGLQQYADDVDGELYQFYKKIWLMCDKAVSEKDSASNGSTPK